MNFDEWWNKEGLLYFGSGTEQDAREIWNAAQATERDACADNCCAAADRLAACPPSPENKSAISALRYRAAAIRARGQK